MTYLSHDSLERRCRKRLEHFIRRSPDVQLPLPFELALAEVTRIAWHNFSSRRFEHLRRYRRTGQTLTSSQYLDLLIQRWCLESERVRRLADDDEAEWMRLYGTLAHLAARMLRRYPVHSAANEATDLAQRACERIRKSFYPCDVPFNAWATTILKNLVLEPSRSGDALDEAHDPVDTTDPALDMEGERAAPAAQLPDERVHRDFDQVEDRDLLDHALQELSPLRRQVIELTYFQDWSDLQIARQLGKNKGAIQTLRHRALGQLAYLLS